MFPDGGHYGDAGKHGRGIVNDMLAYRSKDGGRTWEGTLINFPPLFGIYIAHDYTSLRTKEGLVGTRGNDICSLA